MHSSTALAASDFAIEIDGREASFDELFPGFEERDRLGVVLRDPFDALGASALICRTVTAFYDALRAHSGDEYHRYADFYLFGAGCDVADYGELDLWPGHKYVRCDDSAESLVQALNDRAVTRLLVPQGERREGALERQTRSSALARITTALAYAPDGRAEGADVAIQAGRVVESYVEVVLFALDEQEEARRKRWRETLFTAPKSARETYRRLDVADALALL